MFQRLKLGHAAPFQRDSVLLLTVFGGLLRAALACTTLFHPSPELATIQGDHFLQAGGFLLRHGDIPDPVFVPVYIYLCAWCERLFGSTGTTALVALQVCLGTACIPLGFYLGKKFSDAKVGLVAALLICFDPLLMVQSALVLTEPLYVPFLLLTVVFFVLALREVSSSRNAIMLLVLAGAGAGVCALTRSVGLVIPAAVIVAIVLHKSGWVARLIQLIAVLVPFVCVILPVCLHNQTKYGHFAISSSGKFNMAALMIGPAKRSVTPAAGVGLLDMWSAELGPNYEQLPPFVMADRASVQAVQWGRAHPARVLASMAKGQSMMLVAPDRSSWAAEVAWLHLGSLSFKAFCGLITMFRAVVTLSAFFGLVICWRRAQQRDLLMFFIVLVAGHMIGAGATGSGRFVAPVSPYFDLFSAAAVVAWMSGNRVWVLLVPRCPNRKASCHRSP
jgi:4-amino-4-deoxy-L-arabinose transferase-like glycosyltransferase